MQQFRVRHGQKWAASVEDGNWPCPTVFHPDYLRMLAVEKIAT